MLLQGLNFLHVKQLCLLTQHFPFLDMIAVKLDPLFLTCHKSQSSSLVCNAHLC